MEKNSLRKILGVVVIIAIGLISFVGIYERQGNTMVNILPNYQLGMNLDGSRSVKLSVSDHTHEIIYDADGNISTDGTNEDGSLKEGYTKKDEPVNKEEMLNTKNYETSKEIIKKRLKTMKVSQYIIRQNKENGEIVIELPENMRNRSNYI